MTDKILDVQDVSVSFDGFKVLEGLNFSIHRGEIRFLIGPNGAGKSTLLDIITGKTKPTKGRVLYDGGQDIHRTPEYKRVRQGIGRKFQTPAVFSSLSVYENLEAAIGFQSRLPRLLQTVNSDQKAEIETILETVGLHEKAALQAGLLSHGQKQWLEIGMLLVQKPKLMLLDEPVAGMTRRERDKTGELLHRIGDGRSILVVEHDMQFVRQFASTVSVLHSGKLLCEGPVEQVQADPQVIEVYLGRKHQRVA
jgi:urea transport system ATP-binding protein